MKDVVFAYKGFNRDFTCRGFQYRVGETYEHRGKVKACVSGFHACVHPLDVLSYYAPATSRFAEVALSGELSLASDDSKIAASRITIEEELPIHQLIDRAIKYVFDHAKQPQNTVNGYGAAATASGHYNAASAAGDCGIATASGRYNVASAIGEQGAATATGYYSVASATGEKGAATATGHYSAVLAAGCCGTASASGHYSAALASGYCGAASATGDSGAASAAGDYGAASATGEYGAASASGYYSAALVTSSGGAATASGRHSTAIATGRNSRASGKEGCALFLVERDESWKIINVWTGIVGKDGIKPDVFYTLRDGKPVEVDG
jgi:hypothetical protein